MATKTKKPAKEFAVPQSRDECAARVKDLGDVQRDEQRLIAEMNDRLAAITQEFQPTIDLLREKQSQLLDGIATWCEANREALTSGGKIKSAQLVTGEIGWRQRPPSVTVRGADKVIDVLHKLGLGRFVRTKDEIDKEAILKEPKAVAAVPGVTVNSGVEDFYVTPFEAKVPTAEAGA